MCIFERSKSPLLPFQHIKINKKRGGIGDNRHLFIKFAVETHSLMLFTALIYDKYSLKNISF
jgi:hypothetical protein